MMIIRPYHSSDQRQVVELVLSIQRDEFAIPITIHDQPDLLEIPNVYQCDRGNFWIAKTSDQQIIGTIALIDIGHQRGALRKMFVHREFRGKAIGCAQTLLDTLLAWARDHGMTEIYLGTIDVFKAAHRFYEKNGFVELPESDVPSYFPKMTSDTKFYTLKL
ncbi:MAG TPA: GNAT family N-acetyltransferase [Crinalium sp.]|jgi:GNAT superfamily N-acetyltransferase